MSAHWRTLRAIRADYRRHRAAGSSPLSVVLLSQGFWATCTYRLAHKIYRDVHTPVIRPILLTLLIPLRKTVEIITGIDLQVESVIGEGLFVAHSGPTGVHPGARMGRNCTLTPGAILGHKIGGRAAGCPTLGDRVYVGPHAIIIGGFTIGDDALIGAGAVVTKNVPPRGVVAGNPAIVISYRGSFDYIRYDGMESDPDRLAALEARQSALVPARNKGEEES